MLGVTDFGLGEIQAGRVKIGWASAIPAKHAIEAELLVPHFHKKDLPLFATFRTEAGLELLPAARDKVLARLLEEHGNRYVLFAAVVMGDHAHVVLQASHAERGWPFDVGSILTSLKEGSALEVRKCLGGNLRVWQDERSRWSCGRRNFWTASANSCGRIQCGRG